MLPLLIVDACVTSSLVAAMAMAWKKYYHHYFLTRVGFQIAVAGYLALLTSIVWRIGDVIETGGHHEIRSGYVFAILSRFGLSMLFMGKAFVNTRLHEEHK